MSTTIDKAILTKIEFHLEKHYPNEACGFLLGNHKYRFRHITQSIEVENISSENQGRRFMIDPLDYLKAEKLAAREDLTLLGIYHSHPDHPAMPSIHDLEFAQPFFSYFIHSVSAGKMIESRSHRLVNGKFVEEHFSIHQTIEIKI